MKRVVRALAMALALALALAFGAFGALTSPASAAPQPRVTVFGDSVQASFSFVPQAVQRLSRGIDLRLEARVCRKLATGGCLGGSPESVLAIAQARGPALGELVVVHVGYNDFARAYDIDAVLRAFQRAGVRTVVWVTLREAHRHYGATNALIRAAARRAARRPGLPTVRVADWNAFSVGRPWFTSDGVHLNASGALGLADLLRQNVLAGLADAGASVGARPVTARSKVVPLGREVRRIAGDEGVLWLAGAGRLTGIHPRTGRRLPRSARLGPGESLASDGRQAWRVAGGTSDIARPARSAPDLRGKVLGGLGPRPLLARAGGWLWAVRPNAGGQGHAAGEALTGVRLADGERRELVVPRGRVQAAAASPRALWLLVQAPGGTRTRLEQRDPRTGRLLRTVPVPRRAATGALVAGRRGAWVLTGNGQLLTVRGDRVRRVLGRVRAIAGRDAQLWALRRDRRTVARLHPLTGRVRETATSDRPLSGRMTFTRAHLWVVTASGRHALRVSLR